MNWRPGRIDERMMHRATLSVMTAAAVTDKRVPTASGRQHTLATRHQRFLVAGRACGRSAPGKSAAV